ncbi:MAG: hypothetical protein HDT43_00195 [Ruminococcaceae bacterium]|nr:hypothetical protein [Oscillospiraceae bacterium]
MESLTETEYNAVIEDMTEIYPPIIEQLVAIADKHNFDRDDIIKHFAKSFSVMAEVSTFKNWRNNDGQN